MDSRTIDKIGMSLVTGIICIVMTLVTVAVYRDFKTAIKEDKMMIDSLSLSLLPTGAKVEKIIDKEWVTFSFENKMYLARLTPHDREKISFSYYPDYPEVRR